MDKRLKDFLKGLWKVRRNVPYVRQEELSKDQWNAVVDFVYQRYHHAGISKPEPRISEKQFDLVIESFKTAPPENWLVSPMSTNDIEFVSLLQTEQQKSPEFRVYVNTSSGHAGSVATSIIKYVQTDSSVTGFKIAKRHKDFDDFSDPIVVYCDGRAAARKVARALRKTLSDQLQDPCVEFGLRIGVGIAIGQSPANFKCSFGELRSLAIAKAMRWYYIDVNSMPDDKRALKEKNPQFFSFLVERCCDEFGIDSERTYLNRPDQTKEVYDNRYQLLDTSPLQTVGQYGRFVPDPLDFAEEAATKTETTEWTGMEPPAA